VSKPPLWPRAELSALFAASVRVRPSHHRAKDDVWFRIDNACELDLELERIGTLGPERLRLPARAGIIVRLSGAASMPADGLRYKVSNVLIGPDEPLTVQLTIPSRSVRNRIHFR